MHNILFMHSFFLQSNSEGQLAARLDSLSIKDDSSQVIHNYNVCDVQ